MIWVVVRADNAAIGAAVQPSIYGREYDYTQCWSGPRRAGVRAPWLSRDRRGLYGICRARNAVVC